MRQALILLSSVLALCVRSHNSTCLPVPKTCTYYKDCLEPVVQCGPEGYPLAYGYHYCSVFKRYMSRFSPHGQEFLYTAMLCLQNELIPVSSGELRLDCPELRRMALSTHFNCYTEGAANVCTLSVKDLTTLAVIIRREFFNTENYPTFVKVFGFCGTHPLQLLQGQINTVSDVIQL